MCRPALLAAACILAAVEGRVRAMPVVEVHGHMGARADFPPNSWPAFEHALGLGVDALEIDVVATQDDRLVLTHDLEIDPKRCARADGAPAPKGLRIRALRLSEVKGFYCGGLADPRFPGQRPAPETPVLSLEELFDRVGASGLAGAGTVRFNIEPKTHPLDRNLSPSPEQMAGLVLRVVLSRMPIERVLIQSFDPRTLRAVKRIEPRVQVAWLKLLPVTPLTPGYARKAGADVVSPKSRWVTPGAVRRLHQAGLRIIPWAPNTEREWDKLIEAGVDGIITDDPGGLIKHLERRGLR